MSEPLDDDRARERGESGSALLREAGGAVAFGAGLLLVAVGLLLLVLGIVGAPTVVGQGIAPVAVGILAVLGGVAIGAAGLVALYRRLVRR